MQAKGNNKRILIYGAGVMGSLYAARFALTGCDVTLLARNKRLDELKLSGLRIKRNKEDKIEKAQIHLISELVVDDNYDFIFVTLHKNQVDSILPSLKANVSNNIVFMVNTSDGYDHWTSSLGKGPVIAAFPGAGGKLENGIVYYEITPKMVQATTFGESDGSSSTRLDELKVILSDAGFSTDICKSMDAWQKTHVAMFCPLVNVILYDGGTNYTVAKNADSIKQLTLALKENFKFIKKSGIGIVPSNLSFLLYAPLWLLNFLMKIIYNTSWAETNFYTPAITTPKEFELLSNDFIKLAASKGFDLKEFKKLNSQTHVN